jgi:predicted RNA binding protein YcfA (HicA-like mRNA interferase family)
MRLPRITARKIIKVLKKKGFRLARQSGSHMIFRNDEGVRVTVPYHSGKTLHPKLLKRVMEDANIAPEEL